MLRICRKLNIKSTIKYSNNGCTRQSANPQYIAENILNREFTAKAPNEKWLTDVTEFHYYIGMEKHKIYLSAILDLYDRRIVSYVIRDKNNNALVFDTVDNALLRNPGAQPLFHSDRGFQYTNRTFHTKLVNRIPGGDTLWLLATGSGLSPFASIVRSSAVWDAWKDIVLVESVRKIEEAALARELVLSLPADRRPKLIVTTTREEDPARQGDLTGRIPELLKSGELEKAAGREITPEKSRLMLCGNPDFIADARATLKARGIVSPRFGKPGQLVVENFW